MDYNTDRPIDSEDQDLLGRASFSKQLGKTIYECNGEDGLVIGLFGKWGTGKTSVINMAVNEINKLAENDNNKPLIMKFAPWNYSDKDNLISLFFNSLKNKINISGNDELQKKIGKALSDYSGAFDALSIVPVVGSGVAVVLKTLAQAQGASLMQDADLDKTREVLEKELITAKQKIIIVIDDIDRLTNSQIRDVFQLVKQVADFPNVIYVLSMDREVVRSALAEVHNIDGNEYLEKIIQVPFELPELRRSKLQEIFFAKLDKILNNLPGKVELDMDYWRNVFRNCIEPYINTLRDVNRLINTFQFRYGMLYQETSFEDMVGITTLEVFEPKLYQWICNNKDAVCGGIMHGFLQNGNQKSDYRKLYHDEFVSLKINPDFAIKCVSTMFPVFAKDVNEYQYGYQTISNIRGNMRVAQETRFESYFMLDFEDIKVSRNIINICISELNKEDLRMVIEEINKQGNIVYFIEEMQSLIDKIPYARLDLIASVMLGLQGGFKGETSKSIFKRSACEAAEYLTISIIKRLNSEEEKNNILRSAVKNANKNGLGTMASIIYGIEFAYGRLARKSENKNEQIINLIHLEELEKIYLAKIEAIANSETILDMNQLSFVFYLWKFFDKNGADDYLKKLFKNDANKLKYICAMSGRSTGTNGSGWMINPEEYSEYISSDEVYEIIESLDKSKLNEFSDIEKIKLASFDLNHNKNRDEFVNEQDAQKLVNEWNTEKKE